MNYTVGRLARIRRHARQVLQTLDLEEVDGSMVARYFEERKAPHYLPWLELKQAAGRILVDEQGRHVLDMPLRQNRSRFFRVERADGNSPRGKVAIAIMRTLHAVHETWHLLSTPPGPSEERPMLLADEVCCRMYDCGFLLALAMSLNEHRIASFPKNRRTKLNTPDKVELARSLLRDALRGKGISWDAACKRVAPKLMAAGIEIQPDSLGKQKCLLDLKPKKRENR